MANVQNFVGGKWQASDAVDHLPVHNPATAEILASVPLSPAAEVDQAAGAAAEAFQTWRRTPAVERVQHLFKLKHLLEEHFEELPALVYLKGFLRAYAKVLNINEIQMVDGYVKRYFEWKNTSQR